MTTFIDPLWGYEIIYPDDWIHQGSGDMAAFAAVQAALGHEYSRVGQGNFFPVPVVNHLHAPPEFARADPDKGDPVAMSRVHISLNFKRKTRKRFFKR